MKKVNLYMKFGIMLQKNIPKVKLRSGEVFVKEELIGEVLGMPVRVNVVEE